MSVELFSWAVFRSQVATYKLEISKLQFGARKL